MLLEFSSDILEGWARVCCVHVFLVAEQRGLNDNGLYPVDNKS